VKRKTNLALRIGPAQSNGMSSYDAEIIAASVGASIATAIGIPFEVVTDCKSLHDVITNKNVADFGKKSNMSALQTLAFNCPYIGMIRWTKSHPERRTLVKENWSRDEYGNYMADRIAAGDWLAVSQCAEVYKVERDMDTILKWLMLEQRWHWIDKHGSIITDTISARVKQQKMNDYLEARDQYRAIRGNAPIWKGTKSKFASLQFELVGKSIGEVARCVRIIWE